MKKNEKIFIAILLLIMVIFIGIIVGTKYNWKMKQNINIPIGINVDETSSGEEIKEAQRIVKVDGILYYDTGEKSTELRCGVMDGKITSNIAKDQIPTEDNQSNFEGEYDYQVWGYNEIQIFIDNEWCVFKAKEYSFCGVIKQIEEGCFFVEPDEDEEIRKSADLIMIVKSILDTNVKFVVGERVKITYDGEIMETYPAQIKAIRYENIENNEFTIKVYDKSPEEVNTIYTVLDKSETDKYDYSIYAYKVNVNIVINGEELSLRNALLENKITIDEIIEKANKDIPDAPIYKDGGSIEYHYDLYTIIKLNKIMGIRGDTNKDVYIGMPDLNINDIEL